MLILAITELKFLYLEISNIINVYLTNEKLKYQTLRAIRYKFIIFSVPIIN